MKAFIEALYKTSAKKGSDGPLYQKPENKLPYGNKAEEKMHERLGDQLKETHDNGNPHKPVQGVPNSDDVEGQVQQRSGDVMGDGTKKVTLPNGETLDSTAMDTKYNKGKYNYEKNGPVHMGTAK